MAGKKTHWTTKGNDKFRFAVASHFIDQVLDAMDEKEMKQNELAALVKVSEGRISQLARNPGNLTLRSMIDLARALKMKMSILLYDDGDVEGKSGPINPLVFSSCWQELGKPKNNWDIKERLNKTDSPYEYEQSTIPAGLLSKNIINIEDHRRPTSWNLKRAV